MRKLAFSVIWLLVLFAPSGSRAQDFWEPASGAPVGTISAFTLDRMGNIFAGTDVGLYRSSDNGISWSALNVDPAYIDGFGSLAVDSAGNIYAGENGAFRSTDDGASWVAIDSGLGASGYFIDVGAIAAAQNGVLFAGGDDGIYSSTNSGNSWTQLDTGLTFIRGIAIDRNGNVFAGTFGSGVFRSSDSGKTWQAVNSGLANLHIASLITNNNGDLYASNTNQGPSVGVYHSSNGGVSWENIAMADNYVYALASNGSDGLLWGTGNRISYSFGNQNTYRIIVAGLGIISAIICPNGNMLIGTEGDGFYSSVDTGNSWQQTDSGLTNAEIQTVTTAPNGDVFTGANGPYDGGIFRSMDSGHTWIRIDRGFANGNMEALAVNSNGHILAATVWDCLRSTDSGHTWMEIDSGLQAINGRLYDINSFAINKSGEIFAGTDLGGVFRTSNEGDSWEPVDSGMTDVEVTSLAIDRQGLIYATTWPGVGDGSIFRSSDDGNSWVNVCKDLTKSASSRDSESIGCITICPNGHVFVSTYSHGIFRSTDSGATWTSAGFTTSGASAIASDSNGNLVASIYNKGIFRSTDEGANWLPYLSGLTQSSAFSLAASTTGLFYASTYMGVFRTTNIFPSGVEDQHTASSTFALIQNSPNPFAQTTNISFTLNDPSFITLKLFNPLGSEVAVLANGFFDAGEHEITFDRGDLPDGVYFYRLEAGGESQTRSFVVLR